MKIHRLTVSEYISENCFIVENEDTKECILIDTGSERERIRNFVKEKGLSVVCILLTHAHFDHIGACDCFDVPIYIFKDEMDILKDNNANLSALFGIKFDYDVNKLNLITLEDGQELEIADMNIKVIHTKGHTKGSVCYLFNNKYLFSGDTLFKGSVGRTDFISGNQAELLNSLKYLIKNLDESIEVFPAHGESTTIGYEKKTNVFCINLQ